MRVVNLVKLIIVFLMASVLCGCESGGQSGGQDGFTSTASDVPTNARIISLDGNSHVLTDSLLFQQEGKPAQLLLRTADGDLNLFFSLSDQNIKAGDSLTLIQQDLAQAVDSGYQGKKATSGSLTVLEVDESTNTLLLSGDLGFSLEDGRALSSPVLTRVRAYIPSSSTQRNSPVDVDEIFQQAGQQ